MMNKQGTRAMQFDWLGLWLSFLRLAFPLLPLAICYVISVHSEQLAGLSVVVAVIIEAILFLNLMKAEHSGGSSPTRWLYQATCMGVAFVWAIVL